MNFITYRHLNNLIYKNLSNIPQDVDLIVGLPRSGMLIANMISLYLNLPLTDIDALLDGKMFESGISKKKDNWIKNIKEARKILVVEDSSNTGASLDKFRTQIENYKYKDKIILLTVFVTNETKNLTDIYFEICAQPRMFEWNYMHHIDIVNSCFDIDGVLCEDPSVEQNDDGEKYVDFIRNAPLKIKPTTTIGYLVTSRLEKYRKDTEYWLEKNEIKYKKLYMLDLESKEERQALNSHATYKADIYKKLKDCNIFIESEDWQAEEICKLTGKSVFCVGNQEFYGENYKSKLKRNIKKNIKNLIPKRIKKFIKKFIKLIKEVTK